MIIPLCNAFTWNETEVAITISYSPPPIQLFLSPLSSPSAVPHEILSLKCVEVFQGIYIFGEVQGPNCRILISVSRL